ncbi:MAG: glycosyltransferase family 1 protein [Calditrichaeota bacterium]|nr:glycosyltransferase [Calditrichota bacterium]RQW08244.1 MAG: glycosyltransferase family 1 protein [Calditrichota bacterium]
MKICDLTQAYTDQSGGIKTYIDSKRQYISRYSNNKHLLIIPGEKDYAEKNGNLTVYQVKSPVIPNCEPYRFILRLWKVFSILKEEEPDIIELGSPYVLPWPAFYYRQFKKCVIFGFYHTDFPDAYVKPFIQQSVVSIFTNSGVKIARSYSKLIYNQTDAVFTSSGSFQSMLTVDLFKPVHYVALGVDINLFHPAKRSYALRRSLGVRDDDVLLIYAGRMDQEKKVDQILSAFRILTIRRKYKLLLIGEGPLRKSLEGESQNLPGVIFRPYIENRSLLAKYLASSDIYVTAGPYETFGLSVLEAQASGLASVGVDAGALQERITPEIGILGEVNNPDQFAVNILKIAENGLFRKKEAARKTVESNYSWTGTFQKIFTFYEHYYKLKSIKYSSPNQLKNLVNIPVKNYFSR